MPLKYQLCIPFQYCSEFVLCLDDLLAQLWRKYLKFIIASCCVAGPSFTETTLALPTADNQTNGSDRNFRKKLPRKVLGTTIFASIQIEVPRPNDECDRSAFAKRQENYHTSNKLLAILSRMHPLKHSPESFFRTK